MLRSRHFIYVEDVAKAFLKILHKGVVGEVYNIGCEEECTNLEIAEKLVHHAGTTSLSTCFVHCPR